MVNRCRAGLIVGDLERAEYRTLATYHHVGGAVAAIETLVRQLTAVDASTSDILDAICADMGSDAVYGNGRRSDNPHAHDERRSADLLHTLALPLGYSHEHADRLCCVLVSSDRGR
ncbi:hypothetical protein [Nocardia sp. NPDC047038]|uniref:hypothetical protein n=1 Tax=Nocardia sp. NPDC047038 TaxID=3154338 RepID=UPI0033EA4209